MKLPSPHPRVDWLADDVLWLLAGDRTYSVDASAQICGQYQLFSSAVMIT